MSVVAKLKVLDAIKITGSPGSPDSDLITLTADPDIGMLRDAQQGMSKGERMLFEFYPKIQELFFNAQVKLRLSHYDNFSGRQYILGTVFIVAGEVGLGERKQQFTGEGAHYELTYTVVAA
jgi:hypothetical protein